VSLVLLGMLWQKKNKGTYFFEVMLSIKSL